MAKHNHHHDPHGPAASDEKKADKRTDGPLPPHAELEMSRMRLHGMRLENLELRESNERLNSSLKALAEENDRLKEQHRRDADTHLSERIRAREAERRQKAAAAAEEEAVKNDPWLLALEAFLRDRFGGYGDNSRPEDIYDAEERREWEAAVYAIGSRKEAAIYAGLARDSIMQVNLTVTALEVAECFPGTDVALSLAARLPCLLGSLWPLPPSPHHDRPAASSSAAATTTTTPTTEKE